MKEYRIYFQVTSDFFEVVQADRAEDAIKKAREYVDENVRNSRFGAAQCVDVVKVEEIEPTYV